MWRNWYTRTIQNRVPQGLEVRVLSSAHFASLSVNLQFEIVTSNEVRCRGGEKSRFSAKAEKVIYTLCGRGGIGIRVRSRSVSRKGWRFKSSRPHSGLVAQLVRASRLHREG